MCAELIRPIQGTFYAITTKLEKITPSVARAQLRRNLYKYTLTGWHRQVPGSQNSEDFFFGVGWPSQVVLGRRLFRRGSPDPAETVDRRFPLGSSRGPKGKGDLRSGTCRPSFAFAKRTTRSIKLKPILHSLSRVRLSLFQ